MTASTEGPLTEAGRALEPHARLLRVVYAIAVLGPVWWLVQDPTVVLRMLESSDLARRLLALVDEMRAQFAWIDTWTASIIGWYVLAFLGTQELVVASRPGVRHRLARLVLGLAPTAVLFAMVSGWLEPGRIQDYAVEMEGITSEVERLAYERPELEEAVEQTMELVQRGSFLEAYRGFEAIVASDDELSFRIDAAYERFLAPTLRRIAAIALVVVGVCLTLLLRPLVARRVRSDGALKLARNVSALATGGARAIAVVTFAYLGAYLLDGLTGWIGQLGVAARPESVFERAGGPGDLLPRSGAIWVVRVGFAGLAVFWALRVGWRTALLRISGTLAFGSIVVFLVEVPFAIGMHWEAEALFALLPASLMPVWSVGVWVRVLRETAAAPRRVQEAA